MRFGYKSNQGVKDMTKKERRKAVNKKYYDKTKDARKKKRDQDKAERLENEGI